jgi:DNA repair exonuclease SbcCD ATPase subunit
MKLLHLEARKIFSVGWISLDLEDRGLLLVNGYSYDEGSENGAGKSSIANKAIVWGLYGKTSGGARGDSVINQHTDKEDCYSKVKYIGVDEATYIVKRQRNPNSLSLHKDNVNLSMRLERDTQELINKSIGREYKTFIQSDFFGQGRKNSFFELNGNEQKNIVEEILPINLLAEWEEESKKAHDIVIEGYDIVRKELNRSEAALTALREHMGNMEPKYLTWRIENLGEIAELEKVCSVDVKETMDELHKEWTSITADYSKSCDRVKEWKAQLDSLRREYDSLNFSVTCPTCLQPLPKESVSYVKRKRDRINLKGKEAADNIEQASKISGTLLARMDIIEENFKVLDKKKQLEKLKADSNPIEEVYLSTKKTIEDKEEDLKLLYATLKKYDEELDRINFWERAFSKDLKVLMLERACPLLKQKANEYLRLLNNPWLNVSFSIDKELKSGERRVDFSATATSVSGGREYDLLSGGEQQIVNFAVGMALADLAETQTVGASHTMILDEPFTELSPLNCENVVNFLTGHLSKKKSTVLLISNEQNLKGLIPNSIFVTKKNGISSINNC